MLCSKITMAEAALAASLVFVCLGHAVSSDLLHLREGAVGIKFLLTVNDTWDPKWVIRSFPLLFTS